MTTQIPFTQSYARAITASKRVRWDIDRDVIRGRSFDLSRPFLPDGLTHVSRLQFLNDPDKLRLGQIQGRTYANMFGLVERFIGIKMLELCRDHAFGDQVALEALVRFTDEELKHQELFRRVELLVAEGMAPGYEFVASPNAVAGQVLGASTWAVLALTCHIELFTQVHFQSSIDPAENLSELYKDVLLFHWKEESQHALLDELEWDRENLRINHGQREIGVNDLIGLISALDGILQAQSHADARYFAATCSETLTATQQQQVADGLLGAYRWQYIVSGLKAPRFSQILASMVSSSQLQRIQSALAPLMAE
jgi:hypothetical protein